MRAFLLAVALLTAASSGAQETSERVKVQPHLAGIHLGDGLSTVRRLYPPSRDWPTSRRPHHVTRYRVERAYAKEFPAHAQTLFFGMRWGSVVEIEVVYEEDYSQLMTYEQLAGRYAVYYGAPHRSGDRFWWSDGSTVLRVFPAELPSSAASAAAATASAGMPSVELRTAAQVFSAWVFGGGESGD